MDPLMMGLIGLIVFLILLFIKVPIGISFALIGFISLIFLRGWDPAVQILASTPWSWGVNENLLPMPLFILMGQLVFYSAISQDLFDMANKWMGRFPGGIAMATNLACTIFGACCGSSMAAAATFSGIAYPEMKKRNYDPGLSAGVICAGGSLSSLIPPSLGFILIGFLTSTSISALFIAGILPGIALSLFYLATIFILCKRNPSLGPKGESFTFKEMLISMKGVIATLVLFIIVIGGMYLGVVTPSEAGALGALGALIIGIVTRRLSVSKVFAAGKDTLVTISFIIVLIFGANIFNTFLSVSGVTAAFSAGVQSMGANLSPYVVLIIILLVYIPLGMFLDIGAIVLLTVPIVFPPLVAMGFDPLVLAVLIVIEAELGMLTPPVGINSFIVAGMTKVPMGTVFRGVTPFLACMIIGMALFIAIPQISLFLPTLMK
jgi:tripartite ATP-independent transporter DctM subunit